MLSGSATIRFLASFGNVFLSLILGVIAMGFFLIYYPAEANTALRIASAVKEWIVLHAGSPRAESILRFLLEDRQLLLMSFVLGVRFLLGIILLLIGAVWHWLVALVSGSDVAASAAATKDH